MILVALVDCASCGETYQGNWEVTGADDMQDVDAAPVEVQECPSCGHAQSEEWPGWVNHTEAGLQGEGARFMATNRRAQLRNMPSDYATCRVLVGNHTPGDQPAVYSYPGGGYEIVYTCRFCGTEISKVRDRHGFVTTNRKYKYPAGYLLEEGGQITATEKAAVFLSVAGLTSAGKRERDK